jgi:Uma2 family endonuclease
MDVMSQLETRPIDYPESDGKPMAESEEHADELRAAVETLRDWFAQDPKVYVAGNNFIYFVEGDTKQAVSPDCYVVRGVPKRKRRTYRMWEEGGTVPSFVLEITSKSTRREDLGDKMSIYRDDLKVPEYFLFDLSRDWVTDGVRGQRLVGGVYRPIEPDVNGRVRSEELGLELGVVGRELRFYRPGERAPLLRRDERLAKAEAENARLRAELDRLRGGGGG